MMQRQRPGGEDTLALRRGGAHPLQRAIPLAFQHAAAPKDGHPGAAQRQQVARAVPGQVRCGQAQAQRGAPGGGAGARRRLQHRGHRHPARHQLAGKLQVQRAIAGHHHGVGRRDPAGPRQGLHGPGGHHPGQGPAGQRHGPLMRAGRQQQLAWPQQHGAAAEQGGDLVRREGAPDQGVALQHHPGGFGLGAQRVALAVLRIRPGGAVRGQRLQILPARRVALIQHQHLRPGARRLDGGGKAGRAGAHHQQVGRAFLQLGRGGGQRRWLAGRGGADVESRRGLHLAGTLAGAALHRHQAVPAGAHAAEHAARRALRGVAQGQDALRRERRRDRLPRQRRDLPAIEGEGEFAAERGQARAGETHRGGDRIQEKAAARIWPSRADRIQSV
ncbi:hypothetical protein PFY06_09865 [Pseudoroseomonas cervicalis]|nr:hypothetical protein [Pseudoroseomonas cervicalis]WBV41555.1 hypothetical protein PFY06_09865 [Pseudoroseomonas cervicalis]